MHSTFPRIILALGVVTALGCSKGGTTTIVEEEPPTSGDMSDAESSDDARAEADVDQEDKHCDSNVHFETGSDVLSEHAKAQLDELARCLMEHDVDTVMVTGAADPRGTSEFNYELGQRRAVVVTGYLRSRGLHEPDIEVRSVGESGAHEAELHWPEDRRAEVVGED